MIGNKMEENKTRSIPYNTLWTQRTIQRCIFMFTIIASKSCMILSESLRGSSIHELDEIHVENSTEKFSENPRNEILSDLESLNESSITENRPDIEQKAIIKQEELSGQSISSPIAEQEEELSGQSISSAITSQEQLPLQSDSESNSDLGTINILSKPSSLSNWPLTLFAITGGNYCSNDLPHGLKSTWDGATPYFCTDCTLNVSNFWLQLVTANGNLIFSIIWQFESLKTVSQRLHDANRMGEPVMWIITLADGSVKAMRGIWRWGSSMVPEEPGFSTRAFCFGAGDYVDGDGVPPMYGHCSHSKMGDLRHDGADDICDTLFDNGEEYTEYKNVESKMYATPRSWEQVGQDLYGQNPGDEFGYSAALSPEGKCLAVGAPWNDSNGANSGVVRVYRDVGGTWNPIGSGILGHKSGDLSGYSVAVSSNCKRVAVGSVWHDGNGLSSGLVTVYENNNGEWLPLGVGINGDDAEDYLGWSVSLSEDGTRLAVGAHGNDENGFNSGHVQMWEYSLTHSSWVKLGENIQGEMPGDSSGWSVSLSGDGTRVVIGAQYNDLHGQFSGHARVFGYDSSTNTWLQVGQDIDGAEPYDFSGVSASISNDGNRIAVGSSGNDDNGSNSGHVRVYEFLGGSWKQMGNSILGESSGDEFGFSVALSGNGTCLAVGARYNDSNGIDSGHVRIHCYNGSSWAQIGEDIDGNNSYDWSGYSVSLSDDGSRVAIGARYNDGNGFKSGQVRVFDLFV